MSLDKRRYKRPRGRQRQALTPDEEAAAGHWLDTITTDPADGTTVPAPSQSAVIFDGTSDIGVMPPGVIAVKQRGRDTHPLAWNRAPLAIEPPPAPEPRPDPAQDIPLDQLAEWVTACTDEITGIHDDARRRDETQYAEFEVSLDAYVANARQRVMLAGKLHKAAS